MRTRIVRTTIAIAATAVAVFIAGSISSTAQQASTQKPTQAQGQSQTPGQPPAFKAKKLTRAELDVLLRTPGKLLILDVRRPDELASIGGFPAFLSIQASQIESHLAFIPKDRTIVTVSNHANRAGRTADLLAARGYDVAGAIGAQDYEAEGGVLVKIARPEPRTSASPPGR